MAGKRRKPGDWIKIANQRARASHELINGRGVSNVPRPGTEIGSAAYQRIGHTTNRRSRNAEQ